MRMPILFITDLGSLQISSSWATRAFPGSSLLSQLGNNTNETRMAGSVSFLSGFFKPYLFKRGFSLSKWQHYANTMAVSDVAGLMITVRGFLKLANEESRGTARKMAI
jgi:hypothetical protein